MTTTTNTAKRWDRAHEVCEEIGAPTEWLDEWAGEHRFLLIQESLAGDRWVETFDTPDEAADYCDSEELGELWVVLGLWNLDDRRRFEPVVRTTWKRVAE